MLGELPGVVSRFQTTSTSVPDDPKKRFGKFEKNRKINIFHSFGGFRDFTDVSLFERITSDTYSAPPTRPWGHS